MDNVDPFVTEAVELIASKDRVISQQGHDIHTLLKALSVHEGRDIHTTALVHLGRSYVPPWGGQEG